MCRGNDDDDDDDDDDDGDDDDDDETDVVFHNHFFFQLDNFKPIKIISNIRLIGTQVGKISPYRTAKVLLLSNLSHIENYDIEKLVFGLN